MAMVCWLCYQLYNQVQYVGLLWEERCLDPNHYQDGDLKEVEVRYHHESSTEVVSLLCVASDLKFVACKEEQKS